MKILEKYIASACAFSLAAICLVGLALSLNPKFAFSATGFALFGYSFLPTIQNVSNLGAPNKLGGGEENPNGSQSLVMQVLALICLGAGQVGIFDNDS